MGFRYLKYLLLKISLVLCVADASGQLKYKNLETCYQVNYLEDNLRHYESIFILRFGFCNGSSYCGNALLQYIEKVMAKTKGQTLFITTDTLNPLLTALASNKQAVIHFIPSSEIEKYGVFSGYNLYINKRKKIKRLI
jgi:hypothetical protein